MTGADTELRHEPLMVGLWRTRGANQGPKLLDPSPPTEPQIRCRVRTSPCRETPGFERVQVAHKGIRNCFGLLRRVNGVQCEEPGKKAGCRRRQARTSSPDALTITYRSNLSRSPKTDLSFALKPDPEWRMTDDPSRQL